MPNTNPPTTTIAALADKVRRAEVAAEALGSPLLDMRFFFGITEAAHLVALKELWTEEVEQLQRLKKRCCGVKLYFDHSTGDQKADDSVIEDVFAACAELRIPLVAHCEDAAMNTAAAEAVERAGTTGAEAHSAARPPESEERSVEQGIALARKHGTAFHVAHLSTKGALARVREAKSDGLFVTCEVAPHHLFLTTDDYATLGTLVKMNPPLRTRDHAAALWEGISDETVDCIATDHAPHTLEEKKSGPPLKAPSGVPGVETMLPLLLTVASGSWPHLSGDTLGALTTDDIIRLCFTRPNTIFNLGASDEPVVDVDLNAEWEIHGADLHSACGWTPYEGWKVRG